MNLVSPVWIWTPHFSLAVEAAGREVDPAVRLIIFEPSKPREMLLTFRSLYDEQGSLTVIVFDVARFPDDTKWAYVADAVGRSGANPLRGLGRLLRSPFIDVSRLYHLPADETGVVATSLGARYSELAPDAALLHSGRPLCGELHSAAVIAHAERLQVTGVLVAEPYLHEFDFLRVLNR